MFAFDFVGLENGTVCEILLDKVELPGEVDGIVEGGVHALAGFGGVSVAHIATHEDPVVESIFISDALADGINGVPFYSIPLAPVRLKYAFGCDLDFLDCRGLARVEFGVRGAGDLDVETNHVVFSRDDHDAAMIGVDGTFHLDVREVGSDNTVHNTPNMGYGVLVSYLNLELLPHKAPRAFATEEIFGLHSLSHITVEVLQLHLDGIIRVGIIRFEASDRPRSLNMVTVLL